MQTKFWIKIIIIFTFILLISACERPASKAPVDEQPSNEIIKTPLPVDQQILNATMTAQAILGDLDQPTQGHGAQDEPANENPIVTETIVPTIEPTLVPTPTSLPPTPVLTKPESYTIQSGEYVYCLARRFDVDPQDILSLNGLSSYSLLSPGMTIKIPTNGSCPFERTVLPHPDTWTVSAGETIYGIACEYGDVYPESIIAVNGLTEPYTLTAGQILQIP
jgi:LysM repeat protein